MVPRSANIMNYISSQMRFLLTHFRACEMCLGCLRRHQAQSWLLRKTSTSKVNLPTLRKASWSIFAGNQPGCLFLKIWVLSFNSPKLGNCKQNFRTSANKSGKALFAVQVRQTWSGFAEENMMFAIYTLRTQSKKHRKYQVECSCVVWM